MNIKTRWNTDEITQQAFTSDILSQKHPSHTNLLQVPLIFMLFVLSKGNRVLINSV